MMETKTIPIEQLKSAPYNPRVNLVQGSAEYERLERSLREFSLVQPIVWNKQTGHIVSGHQRLGILKDWGETEVQVVVVSLTLEREKSLNITLNNNQVGSDWDHDKLASLVTELNDLPDFDATLTGFDEEDLKDFQFFPDPDFEPEPLHFTNETNVFVTMEIPEEIWHETRKEIDVFMAKWSFPVHIKLPN